MAKEPTGRGAVIGGVVGTLVMTAMMYGVAPMMGVEMDVAAMLGGMLGGSWMAGLVMHLALGAFAFPGLFLVGVKAVGSGALVFNGLAWGATLWLMAQVVVMPMMGAGLFSAGAGGPVAAVASLMGHLAYGGLLGLVAEWQSAR